MKLSDISFDGQLPPRIDDARIDLLVFGGTAIRVERFRPWPQDRVDPAVMDGATRILPPFVHGRPPGGVMAMRVVGI